MTIVDGFPVSPELIDFLKTFAPDHESEETCLMSYIEMLGNINKYFCRHLNLGDETDLKQIAEFLESLTYLQDDLGKLEKILPIVKSEN